MRTTVPAGVFGGGTVERPRRARRAGRGAAGAVVHTRDTPPICDYASSNGANALVACFRLGTTPDEKTYDMTFERVRGLIRTALRESIAPKHARLRYLRWYPTHSRPQLISW